MKNEKDILGQLKSRKIDTPDATYFEQMAKDVIKSQKAKITPLYKRPAAWISGVAAALIISFTLINIVDQPIEQNDTFFAMNNVSNEEILNYVNDHIDDFDTELICEAIHEDSLKITTLDSSLDVIEQDPDIPEVNTSIDFNDISPDDILNYIENQGLDIDDLDDEPIYLNL